MEYDLIETPENVELEQRLAGIGSRCMAGLVDLSIIFLVCFVTIITMALLEAFDTFRDLQDALGSVWFFAILIFGFFLLIWGYFVVFELYTNGQTPGKRYMKIRVVKEGGGAIDFTDIAIRNLLRPVDGFPLYPIAGLVMFFTNKCQRLGDLAAGTVVVSEAQQDYSASADRPKKIDWTEAVSAESLRKTRLTPEELRVLTSYQKRRDQLTLDARQRLLGTLLPPILIRLGRPITDASLGTLELLVDQLLSGEEDVPMNPRSEEQA